MPKWVEFQPMECSEDGTSMEPYGPPQVVDIEKVCAYQAYFMSRDKCTELNFETNRFVVNMPFAEVDAKIREATKVEMIGIGDAKLTLKPSEHSYASQKESRDQYLRARDANANP
jgi:hypothetical protein